jgi:uncharacterized membrane protein
MTTLPPPEPSVSIHDHNDVAHSAAPRASNGPSGSEGLFGISFSGLSRAQEFLLALNGLALAGHLTMRDAVVVVKDFEGKVRVAETIDPQPGRSALSGATWIGLLGLMFGGPVGWIAGIGLGAGIGALTAKLVDLGIPDAWVDWFKDEVGPGTATVVALADDIDLGARSTEVARFAGAKLVHTTMTTAASTLLAGALVSPGSKPVQPMS